MAPFKHSAVSSGMSGAPLPDEGRSRGSKHSSQPSCGAPTSLGAGLEEVVRPPSRANSPKKTKIAGSGKYEKSANRKIRRVPDLGITSPDISGRRGRRCADPREPAARLESNERLRFRQRVCGGRHKGDRSCTRAAKYGRERLVCLRRT